MINLLTGRNVKFWKLGVAINSFLTLCVSFSKVLILFHFDLISSSSNLSWHFLYTWELLRCLFTNLKRRNFGITPFFSQSNKNLRSSYFLTKASPYLFLIISAIDFTVGNQILSDIITNRYGEAFVKKIWRIKKCDFKLRKCHLDLRFLLDCKKNGVIPKFLRFKLANRHLNNSHVYRKCQNQSKRGLILWKMIHRGLRKNYKEHFLY